MVHDCLRHSSSFGVCISSRRSEVGSREFDHPMGCLVEIVDWGQDDSGLFTIVAKGIQKFRVTESVVADDGLLVGKVVLLDKEPYAAVPNAHCELVNLLKSILAKQNSLEYKNPDYNDATWVGGRLAEVLPISADIRQTLFVIDDPLERLRVINDLLQ